MIVLIGGEDAATPSSLKPICGWAFGWFFGGLSFFGAFFTHPEEAFSDPSTPQFSKIAGEI